MQAHTLFDKDKLQVQLDNKVSQSDNMVLLLDMGKGFRMDMLLKRFGR
jgi:hypothetical protein